MARSRIEGSYYNHFDTAANQLQMCRGMVMEVTHPTVTTATVPRFCLTRIVHVYSHVVYYLIVLSVMFKVI